MCKPFIKGLIYGLAVLSLTMAPTGALLAEGEEAIAAPAAPAAAAEDEARPAAAAPRDDRRPPRESYLGVFSRPLPASLAAQLEDVLEEDEGVLIVEVAPGSPADKAGLRRHDVLATWNGEKLTGTAHLHRQITAEQPGTEVELVIVRGARRETVRVPLGERPGFGRRDPREMRLPEGTFWRGRAPFGRDWGPRPGGDSRWRQPRRGPQQSISLTPIDGTQYRLHATWTDEEGKPQRLSLRGTLEELHEKLEELPEDIRDDVERSLDSAGEETRRGPGFRFRLQPRIEGGQRRLRISVSRPGQNGGSRIFELDHTFGTGEVHGERLLEIDGLADELRELAPGIREEVEKVLRKVRIPRVRGEIPLPPAPEEETQPQGDVDLGLPSDTPD